MGTTMASEKVCTRCDEIKPLTEFHRYSRNKDGRTSDCKQCRRVNTLKWVETNNERHRSNSRSYWASHKEEKRKYDKFRYSENVEGQRERHRIYYANNKDVFLRNSHKRRARLSCSVPQRWVKGETDNSLCYWCGVDLASVKSHLEHIMPISLGGPAVDSNEVFSCEGCNWSKNDKHPLVWIAELVSSEGGI